MPSKKNVSNKMHDRVVALQLLLLYWLAVILPPTPRVSCFSAVYNDHLSTNSRLSAHLHQGHKFGGYKILPKPCKDTSSRQNESGVCMFNYKCTQRGGTAVGSCMDGFLYGTCCKLPPGVSLPTVSIPETTTLKPFSASASDRSTTFLKPHIGYSPEETFLLYKNGTIVHNVNSPDDFLLFPKQQTPLISQTSPIPETQTSRLPSLFSQTLSSSNLSSNSNNNNNNNSNGNELPISSSQKFDPASVWSIFSTKSTSSDSNENIHSSPKPYPSTINSREPFSPNFSSSKYSTHITKISPFTTAPSPTDYFNKYQSSKIAFGSLSNLPSMIPATVITNKNDVYDNEENLIRVPTLTADNAHTHSHNTPISNIMWLLNDTTKVDSQGEFSTQPTQSFFTWLSVQNNPDKGGSSFYSTKPIHNLYSSEDIPSTPGPSTSVHHILGPSYYVTPEVKITPKPQNNVIDSAAPTVIVLTSASHNGTIASPSSAPSTKKPVHNYMTTASYNVSYHFAPTGSVSTSAKPTHIKPVYSTSSQDTPNYSSILITAKPSQASFSGSLRPQSTSGFIKPVFTDYPNKPSSSNLHTSFPVTSSPLPVKPLKTTVLSTLQASYTKIKPPTETTVLPPSKLISPQSSASSSYVQTTLVTTAEPIWAGNLNSDSIVKPTYAQLPIPTFSNIYPTMSTSNFVAVKPLTSTSSASSVNFNKDPTILVNPSTHISINTTESIFDFPPVRDPNVNLTATQQEKPLITSTTFGDEEPDSEVTPQFVVDKTLEDKVHVFVEKIVQSLQGNFEDLEKVLINGESTSNVTVSNSPTKKPSTSKKPTKKPNKPPTKPVTSSSVVVTRRPTKRPTKKPPLASPVVLFKPSTSQATTTLPNKKPVRVTASTTISFSTTSTSTTTEAVRPVDEEEEVITTTKTGLGNFVDHKRECGIRQLSRKHGRIVGGKGSIFGEWPWQVLVREATWLGLFTKNKCGGVLITNRYVITAAHCQPGFLANLVAVFGDYDISGEVESKRSVSKNVRRVIVHRQYNAATFENDIALLELESPIQFDSHIVPICMPEDDEDFTGRMATVTGWGRLKYGGGVPTVLQEVQVPVMENRVCQEMFQSAGHSKVILPSFVCAGYANGQRDSCEGDSGGPLMVEKPDGHWTLVATVSHGIKCAAPYLPGVYMRTTYFKPWLQTITGVQ